MPTLTVAPIIGSPLSSLTVPFTRLCAEIPKGNKQSSNSKNNGFSIFLKLVEFDINRTD